MKAYLYLVFLIFSTSVFAVELTPYSDHKITKKEWIEYHSQITEELGTSRKQDIGNSTEIFTQDLGTQYVVITFTSANHQAHPSWVTEVMTISNNQMHTRVIGFYAGDVEAFTSFYQNFKNIQHSINNQLTP